MKYFFFTYLIVFCIFQQSKAIKLLRDFSLYCTSLNSTAKASSVYLDLRMMHLENYLVFLCSNAQHYFEQIHRGLSGKRHSNRWKINDGWNEYLYIWLKKIVELRIIVDKQYIMLGLRCILDRKNETELVLKKIHCIENAKPWIKFCIVS